MDLSIYVPIEQQIRYALLKRMFDFSVPSWPSRRAIRETLITGKREPTLRFLAGMADAMDSEINIRFIDARRPGRFFTDSGVVSTRSATGGE